MLTHFALEVIVKDRLREINQEIMTRQALREAFGDQKKQSVLLQKLWCRLSSFLARIRRTRPAPQSDAGAQEFSPNLVRLTRKVDPCLETG